MKWEEGSPETGVVVKCDSFGDTEESKTQSIRKLVSQSPSSLASLRRKAEPPKPQSLKATKNCFQIRPEEVVGDFSPLPSLSNHLSGLYSAQSLPQSFSNSATTSFESNGTGGYSLMLHFDRHSRVEGGGEWYDEDDRGGHQDGVGAQQSTLHYLLEGRGKR
ncbi:hypothetical protein K1719_029874 [Acacia pycnantha]|nr:hypothetical protein K1719_029874 [Acacia pycnantha]